MRPVAGCWLQRCVSPGRVDRPPYHPGDFVWCAFPQREAPARPGPQHLAYALVVSDPVSGTQGALLAAYTTSRPWPADAAPPLGVFRFDRQQAVALGQARAFVLDARRIAYVPITPEWFPRLGQPGLCVQGRAPKALQRSIWEVAEDLLTRHAELVEKLGPLWPGRRR